MNIEKNQVKKDKIIDSENDRKKKVNYFINSLQQIFKMMSKKKTLVNHSLEKSFKIQNKKDNKVIKLN